MKNTLAFLTVLLFCVPAYAGNDITEQQHKHAEKRKKEKKTFLTIQMALKSTIVAGLGFQSYRTIKKIKEGNNVDSVAIINSAVFLYLLIDIYDQYQEYKNNE